MKNTTIKKLRNKIWFFLVAFFLPILIFALVVVYLSNQTFQFQHFQNIQHRNYAASIERILTLGPDLEGWQFLIEVTWPDLTLTDVELELLWDDSEEGQAFTEKWEAEFESKKEISITSFFELTEAEAWELVNLANDQVFNNRFRDRFLWRVPTPLVDFHGVTWFFITSSDDRNLNQQYFLFSDVTSIMDQLTAFKFTLLKIGTTIFLIFSTVAYYFANFLVKPSALALERQKQFIADASHELKTPLAIIKSNYHTLMSEEGELTVEQKKWLTHIKFGVERMTNLTHDLLTLAQLDRSTEPLQMQAFNLSDAAELALQSFVAGIFEKNIDLNIAIEPNIILNQNQEKIMQVMVIFLDNAIKYVDESGWVEVSLKELKNQSSVKFTVKNSGPGIPKEKLPQVFERFYRVDESRTNETRSYGLGLAIAREIIEQASGKIFASSIENEETEFSFTLKK